MVSEVFEVIGGSLFIAWILSFFKLDKICIEVLQPLVFVHLTKSHYYFGFIAIVFICWLVSKIVTRRH